MNQLKNLFSIYTVNINFINYSFLLLKCFKLLFDMYHQFFDFFFKCNKINFLFTKGYLYYFNFFLIWG